jgi:RNA polymerase sigma-70 factor (ECF subfamily)
VTTDGELFRRAVGDPEAFEEIFERHARSVWSYVRRRIGAAAAEEVVAETFLIAFQRRDRFDPAYESARPWLLGIATNLVRRRRRDERAYLEGTRRLPRAVPVDETADVERVDAERMRPILVQALMELSTGDRETFLLVVLGELTYTEAAQALGVPVGTVRSRIHRARSVLRERIGAPQAIDDGRSRDDDDG